MGIWGDAVGTSNGFQPDWGTQQHYVPGVNGAPLPTPGTTGVPGGPGTTPTPNPNPNPAPDPRSPQ